MVAHPRRPVVPAVIALVLVLAAIGWWAWTTYGSPADKRQELTGSVEAEEYQVASLIAGRVESSVATEGAPVNAGQVLFRLDDDLLSLQVQQAQAALRAAQASLRQVKDDDGSDAEIAVAKARVDQAAAALRMARVQLGYTKVSTPATGTITAVAANVGETVAPGRALATITDLASLRVSVYVAETDIGGVGIGDRATVVSDGGGSWTGRVESVADEAEFTPNNIETKEQRTKLVYEVRVALDDVSDGEEQLRPGMPVTVRIEGLD